MLLLFFDFFSHFFSSLKLDFFVWEDRGNFFFFALWGSSNNIEIKNYHKNDANPEIFFLLRKRKNQIKNGMMKVSNFLQKVMKIF